jgi:hypothetical protein
MHRPIRGSEFHIETGPVKPICISQPHYGLHEAWIIDLQVAALEANSLVEDDFGAWGFQCVLAAKPNQADVEWWEYIWRLCVSYRALNKVTKPFTFPIRHCDDAAHAIGPAHFVIKLDMQTGYWQVYLAKGSHEKTAFYTAKGKKHYLVMPMGLLNAMTFFIAMIAVMKKEWNELRDKEGIHGCDSECIVDDILLFGTDLAQLLHYL